MFFIENCFSLKIVGLVVVELAFLVVSFAVPCTQEGIRHGAPDGAALGNGCALIGLKNCFSLKIVFEIFGLLGLIRYDCPSWG